jgi:fructokinase
MILVSGEALIDLFIGTATATGFPAEAVAGGSPFNVAIGLGRLGRPAAFLSTLSEDVFGTFLAEKLTESGVSSAYSTAADLLRLCPSAS